MGLVVDFQKTVTPTEPQISDSSGHHRLGCYAFNFQNINTERNQPSSSFFSDSDKMGHFSRYLFSLERKLKAARCGGGG